MNRPYDVVFENVAFSYNAVPVLENVNLKIQHGEFLSVVGPNGGGKTTLLKLVVGLLQPDRGRIRVLGTAPQKARLRIGYMAQYAHLDKQFPVTVMDVVLLGRLGRHLGGGYSKEDRETARATLREVQLVHMADTLFSELSGGQKQRVLIARALCAQPEILLLDEPTANIDVQSGENLLHILKEINRRMTIMLVSHDMGFVSKVVQSVVCVNRRVVIHPTSRIDGEIIQNIYGGEYSMIRHDHRCSEKGHQYD